MDQQQNTHVAVKANKPPPMPLDTLRIELEKNYYRQVLNYFGDEKATKRFMSAVVYSVQKNPKLLEANRASLFNAFLACAEFQLYPSNVAGEAFVIPYKGIAQFQLGYQGIITLLARAGIDVSAQIVREKDAFEYEEGLEPRLVHKPNVFGERGDPVGVYAIARLANGEKKVHVMSTADVMKFKEFSQSKGSDFSPWNAKSDPELWMWRKTCIKQLAKTISKTETIQKALAEDNKDSIIHKQTLDAEGPATQKALHAPPPEAPEVTPVTFEEI